MDKREIFEKWADDQGWPPRGTAWRREAYVIWKAAQDSLFPTDTEIDAMLEPATPIEPILRRALEALEAAGEAIEQWGGMSAKNLDQREQLSDDLVALDKITEELRQLLGGE